MQTLDFQHVVEDLLYSLCNFAGKQEAFELCAGQKWQVSAHSVIRQTLRLMSGEPKLCAPSVQNGLPEIFESSVG